MIDVVPRGGRRTCQGLDKGWCGAGSGERVVVVLLPRRLKVCLTAARFDLAGFLGYDERVALRGEDVRSVEIVQWVLVVEEQVHVFGGLAEKETLHAVALLTVEHVLETREAALGPTAPVDVSLHHLSHVQIPRVPGCPVDMVGGLDELGSERPPAKTALYRLVPERPSLGQGRVSRPDGRVEEIGLDRLVHLTGQGEQARVVSTQAVDPIRHERSRVEVDIVVVGMLSIVVEVALDGGVGVVPSFQEGVG